MNTTIDDIKKFIESKIKSSALVYATNLCMNNRSMGFDKSSAVLGYKAGHEAATSRLLPIIEKALEMFQDTEESLININENMAHYYANQCCPNIDEVNEVLIAMRKAQAFQAFLAELAAGGSND